MINVQNFLSTLKKSIIYFLLSFFLHSCLSESDKTRVEGEVFGATVPGGAVGGLYFRLYNDSTYQICSTGGIGQNCFSGQYLLRDDTLIFVNLNKSIHLKSKLIIARDIKYSDWDSLGQVFQLDSLNNKITGSTENTFIIFMDSLTKDR
jgi:hypothetical protein